MKGRLAALVGPKQVQIREYPLPAVEKGAVLTRVLRSNLCGSELHIWRWSHPLIKNAVMGHEMIAQVETVGEGVEIDYAGNPIKSGDRVVAPYFLTCLKCGSLLPGRSGHVPERLPVVVSAPGHVPPFHRDLRHPLLHPAGTVFL